MASLTPIRNYFVTFACFLLALAFNSPVGAELVSKNLASKNLVLKYNDILVVDNYSIRRRSGLIRVKTCPSCDKENLKLDENSILILKGKQLAMNNLLHTRLKYPSNSVRIQYNRKDKTVTYIRWQASQDQEEGLL